MTVIYKLDSLGFYSGTVLSGENYPIELTTRIAPPAQPWPAGHLANFNIKTNSWSLIDCSPQPIALKPPRPHVEVVEHDACPEDGHYHEASLEGCTVPVGSSLTFKTRITYGVGGPVLPITDMFRLPMVSSDGRERVILAKFVDGYADIKIPIKESGIWTVSEDQINKRLPVERHMTFDGAIIYAYEV